ncbi:MAG: GSCFA domain-containing protein [Paramuribaculum sp.]
MDFRTIADINPSPWRISHRSVILALGSCFAENIGSRLRDRLFNISVNPTGTLYNPASIRQCVERIADGRHFEPRDIFQHDGLWHCFECHSRLSETDGRHMLDTLNGIIDAAHRRLKCTDTILLTFGTAWVYETTADAAIVANCHKLPALRFTRRRLSISECVSHIEAAIRTIRLVAPDAKILLTVSPVRHIADGLHGNQLSKSTLLLAVDQVVKSSDHTDYFPSYELLIDDLRDYRFCAADMMHPSETASDYVFERFASAFFSAATLALAARCAKITRRLRHRQLTADDSAMQRFQDETSLQLDKLLAEAPYLAEAIDNITQK